MVEAISPLLKRWNILEWGYTEKLQAESFSRLENWVGLGLQGTLGYLTGERLQMRQDLRHVFPECQSALVFLFDYNAVRKKLEDERGPNNFAKIASYVFAFGGLDYHHVMGQALRELGESLQQLHAGLEFKVTIDTAPVLDRDLAFRAGLGWFGKNSLLINRQGGSFTLIGSLLLNQRLELPQKGQESDHCGTCRACVDACPTDAIDPVSRTLKAESCLSTFTIEHFKPTEAPIERFSYQEVFGCDLCQDVCPWNKKAAVDSNTLAEAEQVLQAPEAVRLRREFEEKPLEDVIASLQNFGTRAFAREWRQTPIARTGKNGVLKNFVNLMRFKKQKDPET
jgi:epoxyqueuosine reductase